MNEEELIKKLETVELPAVEVPSHRSRLKMALLNADHLKVQTRVSEMSPTQNILKGGVVAMIRGLFSHQPVWKSALAIFIVVVVIGLAVVLPLNLLKESAVSAEQITANSILEASKVSTFKAQTTMTGTMEIIGGSHAGIATSSAHGSSIVDKTNKKQVSTIDMTIEIPMIGKQQITNQTYMVEGWMYMKMSLSGGGERWTKMKMPDLFWMSGDELSKQTELLKTAQKVSLVGTEKMDGIDCYILQIDADMEMVKDWLLSQKGLLSGLDLSTLNSQCYKSFTSKQWIAKDSFLPMKTVQDTVIEILPGNSGSTDDDFEKEIYETHAEMKLFDHNKPMTIELPPEAQSAQELQVNQ
jgi:hypothetical protein